jgi:transcriptional regulator of arginine metabolism
MKKQRLSKILEIIESNNIETQDELLNALLTQGFNVTQATISRDINELRLVKSLTPQGKYKYTTVAGDGAKTGYATTTLGAIRDIKSAENIVIVHTYSGMAPGVAATLDSFNFNEVAGTIAGDDTIFIALKNRGLCDTFIDKLNKMINK